MQCFLKKEDKMKKVTNRTPQEKKAILLKHYTFDEICDIMGYDDESNENVVTDEIKELEQIDFNKFQDIILNEAIINGNFEEVIWYDDRFSI